jgi:hypothetical protein
VPVWSCPRVLKRVSLLDRVRRLAALQAYALRCYQQKVVNDDVASLEPTGKIRFFNKQQRKGRRVVERVYGTLKLGDLPLVAVSSSSPGVINMPHVLMSSGIVKNMWQSLKMRTMFHRDQKIRDCYVAFILHNLKLEANDEFDWGYAAPDVEPAPLAADLDVEAKAAGDKFRSNLIDQMWIDRAERKAAAGARK